MKIMFAKISVSLVLTLIVLLGLMACKKNQEQLDSPTILSKLAGEESTLWRFPSSLEESCTDPAEPLLLLRRDETYLYTQGSCAFNGSWSVNYSSNRSGQDITLELLDEEGGLLFIKLMYSRDNDAFYYVDPEKGLLLLVKEDVRRDLSWEQKTFPTMPENFKGRINTVSVLYNDLVYFGLGENSAGTVHYKDWYRFDGTEFVRLADIDPYPIVGAKALVVNDGGQDKIYMVGGQYVDGGIKLSNNLTYIYDPVKNTWNTLTGGAVQQRSNAVYFMFSGQEVLGLGNVGSTGTNFYTRADVFQPWEEFLSIGSNYGLAQHDYQDALCFPWNGGYFVGGGKQTSGTGLLDYSISWINSSVGDVLTKPATPNNGEGFSEGMGVDMGKYSLVFGINTNNGPGAPIYSDKVHFLSADGDWRAVLPSASPDLFPIPGRSSVLWKVKNAQGQYEVYGGLGSNMSGLYQLKIQ